MRHTVLGAGGIGGLIAGALARSGAEVSLLLRPESLSAYSGELRVESAVLGDFIVAVPAKDRLEQGADLLWLATKATQLEQALSLAPPESVGDGLVVPLLNGVDHLARLRTRYANVVAAAIRVESERVSPSLIQQTSPFLRVDMAGGEVAQEALRTAGIDCRNDDDERSLLWGKLVVLAPIALATTARAAPFGAIRTDERFVGCREEAIAVARAEGAKVDAEAARAFHDQVPADMRSSMQKDVAAGQKPELDAIAGPIIRAGTRHGIPTPNTARLAHEIRSHSLP